jgi:hypothetical protein
MHKENLQDILMTGYETTKYKNDQAVANKYG